MNEDEKIKEIEKKETDIAVRVPIWEGKYASLSIVADSKKGEEKKMKIERDTVIFKSAPEFFQKEQKGIKPNTVRILSQLEEEQLNKVKDQLKTIKIISTETGDSFERGITDISLVILSNDSFCEHECRLFVFSWHHFYFYNDLEKKR